SRSTERQATCVSNERAGVTILRAVSADVSQRSAAGRRLLCRKQGTPMLTRHTSPGPWLVFRWIGCAIVAALFVEPTRAWDEHRLTHLTFSRSVGLPGVTLPAGTYEFRLVDPATNHSFVVVRDPTSPYALRYMGVTVPVRRPANLPENAQVTF